MSLQGTPLGSAQYQYFGGKWVVNHLKQMQLNKKINILLMKWN